MSAVERFAEGAAPACTNALCATAEGTRRYDGECPACADYTAAGRPPRAPGATKGGTPAPASDPIAETWAAVRRRHPALPAKMPVLGSACRGAPTTTGEERLAQILHAAAHALAATRGWADTSRQGRYHNDRFLEAATEVGLACAPSNDGVYEGMRRGSWRAAGLLTEGRFHFGGQLAALERVVDPPARAAGHVGLHRARCACPSPRTIRVARGVLARGPIACSLCGAPFVLDVANVRPGSVSQEGA